MRILYLCQYFTGPDEPGSGRAYGMARRWAERGHEVTVLTGAVNYKRAQIYPECRGRLVTRRQVEGIQLVRLWTFAAFRGSMRRRIPYFLSFAFMASVVGLFVRRPDVVFATSTPLTVGWPGWFLSRWWRCPFVFEVRDPWPEAAVAAGVLRPGALVAWAGRFARFLYRRARAVVALSQGYADLIAEAGIPREKIHFIPNGAEPWILAGGGPRAAAGPEFRCAYAGGLGRWNGVTTILEAAAELAGDPGIRFVVIGEGDERPALEALARERGLANVEFTGALAKRETIERLRQADVCILPGLDRPFYRRILQNKLFDYLAIGRPIVTTSPGEATEMVLAARAGVDAPPEDAAALAGAIRRLRALPEGERRAMGDRGRELARTRYGRVELADRALAVLEEAAEARAPERGRRALGWGVAAVAVLLALAFAPTFRTLWRTWLHNDNYSHGLLIPPVSAFLLWRNRRALGASAGRPSAWGLPVLAGGLLALLAGTRADFTMVQGYSFVIVLLGLVLHFFGRATARQALFPLGYLIFMSPLPPVLANDISFRLKVWVVNFSTAVARWMGIPVAREGMTLHLPTGAVAIENPCSGLRSLVAVLALATLLAYFARRGGIVRRTALVLSAVPIAVAANWVRITLIVFAANYASVGFATGAMHDISGYVLFGADVVGLLLARAVLRC